MKLHLKQSRGNNSKYEIKVAILVLIHCHDLFYITVKYHDNIPKGIRVMERT